MEQPKDLITETIIENKPEDFERANPCFEKDAATLAVQIIAALEAAGFIISLTEERR